MKDSLNKYFFQLLSFAIIAYYFFQIINLSFNFPFYDDYDTILQFLIDWKQSISWTDKIKLLFKQHNEHRVLFLRIVSLASYIFEGNVNFKWLILFGNLALLLIWLVFNKKLLEQKQPNQALVHAVVASLLFQFASWDNAFWAMASLQNFWIHAWVILFFYFYFSKHSQRILWSSIALFFAIFTSGNGFLVLVILLFYLITIKKRKEQLFFTLFSILLISIYFYNFQTSKTTTHHSLNLIELIKFAFGFVGSLAYLPQLPIISILCGGIIFLVYFYLFFIKYYKSKPFYFSVFTFLMLTVAIVALSRAERGFEAAVISRYRINSTLLFIITFLVINDIFNFAKHKIVLILCFVFSLAYNLVGNRLYATRIEQTKENRMTDAWLWEHEKNVFSYPNLTKAKQILEMAKKEQVFSGRQVSLNELKSVFSASKPNLNQTEAFDFGVDEIMNVNADEVLIRGFAKLKNKNLALKSIFFESDSENGKFFVNTLQTRRYDLVASKKNIDYQDCGFFVILPKKSVSTIKKTIICSNSKCYSNNIDLSNIPFNLSK